MWLVKDCLCLKPVAVFLNRLVAPLLVFIFGIFKTPHSVMNKTIVSLNDKSPANAGDPYGIRFTSSCGEPRSWSSAGLPFSAASQPLQALQCRFQSGP